MTLVRLASIARTTLRRALHTNTFLVVTLLAVLFLGLEWMQSGPGVGAGLDAVEREVWLRTRGAADLLNLWFDAALLISLVLGTTSFSAEVRAGTLEAQLAKPLARGEILMGHWLGLQTFLVAFLAMGTGTILLLTGVVALEPTAGFWAGLLLRFCQNVMCTALAVGLGAILRPVSAGGLVVLLLAIPSLAQPWLDHPAPLIGAVARLAYFLSPARLPGEPLIEGLTTQALNPTSGLAPLIMAENLGYAALALLLCGSAFRWRDLR